MATENKITKAMILEMIAEKCADDEVIVEFCNKEIAALEAKKVKAAERAEAKRQAGDELRGVIASVLTAEPQTAEQILAQIEDPDGELTKQKVIARMTQLVNYKMASKVEVTVDGKKRMAYTLPVDAE